MRVRIKGQRNRLLGLSVFDDGGADRSQAYVAGVRTARQEVLLSLVDTGPNQVTFSPAAGAPLMQLNTKRLIVVCAGAFRDLSIAGSAPTDTELEDFGLIPELVCRLTSRLVLAQPSTSELCDLFLHGPDAVLPAVAMCRALGVNLEVAPEAIRMVAANRVACTNVDRNGRPRICLARV